MLITSWRRTGLVAASITLIAGGVSAPAAAVDAWTDTQCDSSSSLPECSVEAGSTRTASPGASGAGAGDRSSRQSRSCEDTEGNPAPCSDPQLGQLGADGCYYRPTTVSAEEAEIYGGAGDGPGGWYEQSCVDTAGGTALGSIVWRADSALRVGPVVVARQAVSRLRLVAPVIAASPAVGRAQLVSLPTWLWIQSGSWAAQSATASAPGVSVTATARPVSVTWSLGDGSTVVCDGPGTPFPSGADPRSASPDCGHTYQRSSADQPGEAFRVTATVTWSVAWVGGGESGDLPELETVGVAALRVAESQALVTGDAGR